MWRNHDTSNRISHSYRHLAAVLELAQGPPDPVDHEAQVAPFAVRVLGTPSLPPRKRLLQGTMRGQTRRSRDSGERWWRYIYDEDEHVTMGAVERGVWWSSTLRRVVGAP